MPSLKQKRGTYRNEGANSIGAFINKDKFEGGACQTGGAYWKEGAKTNHYGISQTNLRGALVRQGALIGRRAPKRIITVSLYCSIKIIAIKPTRLCISVELLEKGLSGAKEFGSRDRYDGTFSKLS